MLRGMLVPGALLAAGCIAGAGPFLRPPGGPSVRVSPVEFDFGIVTAGEALLHRFEVVNAGDRPLTLRDVRSCCDCRVELPRDGVLPAAGKGWIEVEVRTDAVMGPQVWRGSIGTSDPSRPGIGFLLRADVRPALAVEPPVAYLGRVGAGGAAEVRLEVVSAESVTIRKLRKRELWFSMRFEPLTDSRRGIVLYVELAPGAPEGTLEGRIEILADGVAGGGVEVPVMALVDGAGAQGAGASRGAGRFSWLHGQSENRIGLSGRGAPPASPCSGAARSSCP